MTIRRVGSRLLYTLLWFPLVALADEGELDHAHDADSEGVAAIDPVIAGGVVIGIIVIAFLVWKFLLKKK